MLLRDLPETYDKNIKIGSLIYLVRKISGHILETELLTVGIQGRPHCEVRWLKDKSDCYRLDLEKNTVNAIDATPKHRQEMFRLWEIWEPHRKSLTELFYRQLKLGKRQIP